MAEQAWWISSLHWPLWGMAMVLVMGWVGRSRLRARPLSESHRLSHPPSTLIVGLVCFVFFAGLAIVSNVMPNKTTTWWTTSVFVGFAILALPLISGFFLEHHEVSDRGLAGTNFLGVRKQIAWSDLRAVQYAPSMKWFRLETRSGTVARVSVMLMGLPEFARLLLRHAPHDAIDAVTKDVLRETASGNPPSVWA